MATSLADLRAQLIDEISVDPNQRINNPTLLNRNLNRALVKLQRDVDYDFPENLQETTILISGGTTEYDLPSDFKIMGEPPVVLRSGQNDPLIPTTKEEVNAHQANNDPSTPQAFYITATKIGFYPTPDASDTITLFYRKKLPDMTDVVASPLNEDFDEALVMYAAYLTMRRFRGFEDKARDFLSFYEIAQKESITAIFKNRRAITVSYQRRFIDQARDVGNRLFFDN